MRGVRDMSDALQKIFKGVVVILFMAIPLVISTVYAEEKVPVEKNNEAVENVAAADDEADIIEDPFGQKGPHFKFGGQVKDLFNFQRIDNYYGSNFLTAEKKNMAADMKRLRLSPEFRYSDILVIHIDFDNEIFLSSYNKSYEFDAYWRGTDYNDFFDLSWDPYYSNDIYYHIKIHRAYAKINVWNFTFTLGRQQIRFGSGKLWNPLDILNPVSPTFIEGAEDQKGTDAFRWDYYINDITELTLVSNQKLYNNSYDDMRIEDSNTVLRFKITFYETDLALLAGWVTDRALAGIDVHSTAFTGSLRTSLLFSYPRSDGNWYFQASAGYEYTFEAGVYLLVEYFYNQNGMNFNHELKEAYIESFVFGMNQQNYNQLSNQFLTMNQHYAGVALGYDFIPILRGEMFCIYDFQGYGFFVSPSLKYNAAENFDITGGVMFGFVIKGAPESSDFDTFANEQFMYHLSLVYYF